MFSASSYLFHRPVGLWASWLSAGPNFSCFMCFCIVGERRSNFCKFGIRERENCFSIVMRQFVPK